MTMNPLPPIRTQVEQVREIIAGACARAGRSADSVKLVAVSKTHPAEAVLAAAAAGVQHFGENRVEEAQDKIPAVGAQLSAAVTWHMIGHIQSRKAKEVPPYFQVVHSLDSPKLAEKLSRSAVEQSRTLEVLLQVNVSGEESKSGFDAVGWQQNMALRERLWQAAGQIATLPGLRVVGLMTMAPIVEDMEQTRPVFAELAVLREALQTQLGLPLPELSMGMTDDYPVAIEEGATMVRIGRAIFGER